MQHVLAAFFVFKLSKVCLLSWVFVLGGCSLEQHGRWQNSCSERLGGRAVSAGVARAPPAGCPHAPSPEPALPLVLASRMSPPGSWAPSTPKPFA